ITAVSLGRDQRRNPAYPENDGPFPRPSHFRELECVWRVVRIKSTDSRGETAITPGVCRAVRKAAVPDGRKAANGPAIRQTVQAGYRPGYSPYGQTGPSRDGLDARRADGVGFCPELGVLEKTHTAAAES